MFSALGKAGHLLRALCRFAMLLLRSPVRLAAGAALICLTLSLAGLVCYPCLLALAQPWPCYLTITCRYRQPRQAWS